MSGAVSRVAVSPDARKAETQGLRQLMLMADALREGGRFEDAAQAYQQVLAIEPDNLDARIGRMRTLFYRELWSEAWPALDVRFGLMESPPAVTTRDAAGNSVAKPRWTGGPVPRSLLVLDEQGMGDTIQFIRFLPRLVAEGCRVTFVTHRRLFALIRSMGADIDLRPMDEPGRVANVESWIPLFNIPGALGLDTAGLGMPQAYLKADATRVERWRDWLGPAGFKIGISWRGNPKAPVDAGRSATLAAFGPLAAIPGVRLISLQRDFQPNGPDCVPFAALVETPPEEFDGGGDAFLDTAALIENLDLVVAVDTAVVHLAGALGRPVLVALQQRNADWRWTPGRADTPWYPTMRFTRQLRQGDWWSAFSAIAEDVRSLVSARHRQNAQPRTPISVGELIDKITILEIKKARIADPQKRANVLRELEALEAVCQSSVESSPELDRLGGDLRRINESLWDIEDAIRVMEHRQDFGDEFIRLARAVYVTNDRRAALKSAINQLSGSLLREEKSYA